MPLFNLICFTFDFVENRCALIKRLINTMCCQCIMGVRTCTNQTLFEISTETTIIKGKFILTVQF